MKIPDIIVAVDGFSSTGKSTLAKLIAKEFGYVYLDSGAMYRAVTLFAQERGFITEGDVISPSLEVALNELDVHFGADGHTCLASRDVEKEIRSMKVSSQVSPISTLAYVRQYVDDRLHKFASEGKVVMDGRDIGTTVFPNAGLKIFMVASTEVRAKRRYDELKAKGSETPIEEVIKNLQERDYIDSHREISPLKRAEDAFCLDNSDMTLSEELAWVRGLVQGKFGVLGDD